MRTALDYTKIAITEVHKIELCCGCGCCAGICPQKCINLKIDEDKGTYYPEISLPDCLNCGLCIKVCPGIDADQNSNIPKKWKEKNKYHPWIGYYQNLFVGYSQNQDIRQGGASGGVATSFLIHLFNKGLIDGAITSIMSDKNPLLAEPIISINIEELLASQQSKYCPVPVGKILKEINQDQQSRYALIGVPCVIQGIRKAQKLNKQLQQKIPFLISLFCSRTPSFLATKYILEARNILFSDVIKIDYRYGTDHIGSMRVTLKTGKIKHIPHLHFDYWGYMFSKFFIPNRCFLCDDKNGVSADISFGDNWTPYMKHKDGSSSIIVRSTACQKILSEMTQNNIITTTSIDEISLIKSQDLTRKLQNSELRKLLWKILGKCIPNKKESLINQIPYNVFFRAIPDLICFKFSKQNRKAKSLHKLGKIFQLIEFLINFLDKFLKSFLKGTSEIIKIFLSLIPTKRVYLKKKACFKIVMIGGYGSKDIGDESMPHADLLHLRERLQDELEVVMLSVNPEYTAYFHNERSVDDIKHIGLTPVPGIKNRIYNLLMLVRIAIFLLGAYFLKHGIHLRLWPSAFHALREIESADLLFNVGGGNLNTLIPQEFYKKGATYLSAKILNKHIILSGQTIGPFYGVRDKFFARLILNLPKKITFRDKEISRARCCALGITAPILIDAADDAMALPYLEKSKALHILDSDPGVRTEWIARHTNLIFCMNLKGSLKFFTKKGKIIDMSGLIMKFSHLADMILNRYNAKILFIPTDYCAGVDDRELHREIVNNIINKDYIATLENEYDDTTLKGIINLCDIAIGARYHFCVFACALCKPFIGIASGVYQMTKLNGLSSLIGIPKLFYEEDLDITEVENIFYRVQWVIDNYQSIERQMITNVPMLKQKSKVAVNYALQLLERSIRL